MTQKELKAAGWRKISSAPKDGTHVDLWLHIYASPRSMGMTDDFEVSDAHYTDGHWRHMHKGNPEEELYDDYVTHWRPIKELKP